MTRRDGPSNRQIHGTIRRRLLVNAVVDPDEAARHLPAGVRPHVTEVGTVVGCCLLEIGRMRPVHAPGFTGVALRAAAHRISAEWEDASGATTVGVYVPLRHTDSRLATVVGGRGFPGVHDHARVDIDESDGRLRWTVAPDRGADRFAVRVVASLPTDLEPAAAAELVGGTCLAANVGVSPDRRGLLEAARMVPDHRTAREVRIEELDSAFLAGFSTARSAPSYLMADVGVTWTPAVAPGDAARRVRT